MDFEGAFAVAVATGFCVAFGADVVFAPQAQSESDKLSAVITAKDFLNNIKSFLSGLFI